MDRRPACSLIVALALLTACSASTPRATSSPSPTQRRSASSSPKPSHTTKPSSTPTSTAAGISRATCGTSGRVVSFRVSVDAGLPTNPTEFGNAVRGVLCDARSWIGSKDIRFRYDPNGSLLIGLKTPDHTETRCMQLIDLSVSRTYSCGTAREVVLNSDRWFNGSPHWPGPVAEYRQMLTNHETGHALSLYHQTCPRDGAPAPVMMQQSKGLTSSNGATCVRNPWPLPEELRRI